MGNNFKKEMTGVPFSFVDYTYTVSEVKGSAITTQDFGTIDVSAGDSQSVERAVALNSTGVNDNVYRAKYWYSMSNFTGVDIRTATIAALTGTLNTGATRVAYSKAPGTRRSGGALTWIPAEDASHRIKTQVWVNQTEFGALPYDYTKDLLTVPASLNVHFESEEYIQKMNVLKGMDSKLLNTLRQCEVCAIINGFEIPLGYIESGITVSMATTTVDSKVGYPLIPIDTIKTEIGHSMKFTMSVVEEELKALINSYTMTYATDIWRVAITDNTVDLYEIPLVIRDYNTYGSLVEIYIPNAQMSIDGDITKHLQQAKLGVMVKMKPDLNGASYTIDIAGAKSFLYRLDSVFKVDTV